jgi:methylenetetrahydrofolate reductase (NADPH)
MTPQTIMGRARNERLELSCPSLADTILQLARGASIELNFHDLNDLAASRGFLAPGTKLYISHLPKQTWSSTRAACQSVRDAGFDPVPHIPVRLLPDSATLDRLLADVVRDAGVQEVLLIAGDYSRAAGPYSSVADVLRTGLLTDSGLRRISLAGHPEGHPKVALSQIRRAEREKAEEAAHAGLEVTLLTQFFFERQPFVDWVGQLRASGVRARVVAGLTGPAKISTLMKYAIHCGAGASIRVLRDRSSSLVKLFADHGPEDLLRELASARNASLVDFNGIHLFCFGGYLRTCEWLHRLANGGSLPA